jgi:hypothetical protein
LTTTWKLSPGERFIDATKQRGISVTATFAFGIVTSPLGVMKYRTTRRWV